MFDPDQPYNDLPPLPPVADLESKATLKAAIPANRELAELKAVCAQLPNPCILLDAIAIQEARVSSEIEGIVTTTDKLYRALSDMPETGDDPNTREVLWYREALWHGYKELKSGRPLSTVLYEELVRIICQNGAGIRNIPGTKLREQPSGRIVYTPPEGVDVLRGKLANLDQYIHDGDDAVDPLIKLAAIHYQFEAIHPFGDGNGRTGRIVNILYLVHRGLLELPLLYLSRYIVTHRPEYYAGLRGVTEDQAWEPWVLYMLGAVRETARETIDRIAAIRRLMEDYRERVRQKLPKVYSHELIDLLFERPYCKAGFLAERSLAHRQTASNHLKLLAEAGFLTAHRVWREVYYINTEFLSLLAQSPGEDQK